MKIRFFCSSLLKVVIGGLRRAYALVQQRSENLPKGFDRSLYLQLNPDVKNAGVDPVLHYLRNGRREGRIFLLPEIEFGVSCEFKNERETILIVSHEASRTGAPVLSLNIVQAFVEKYNVVALLLGGGPLTDAFRSTGAAVATSSNLRGNPSAAYLNVSKLCEQFKFKFALINSIESRVVLPALADYFVPSISLLHEFAAYTRPREAFREALFWSVETVFSASATLENARSEYPDIADRSAHILPQGRCLVPLDEVNEEQLQAERARIRGLIRPREIAETPVVVLGAGSVQLRKGVDLFIECAARVVGTPGGQRCRFVWIGKGYDPDNDINYSVYLADQIQRAGLQGIVVFIDETSAIETAYEEADLFLLSSRLDPLPNVAIDAMAYGVPVLCFDKATGIADFLIDSGLKSHCVAGYLDTAEMAEKILALVASKTVREDISHRCREASLRYFDMKEYVARLGILAQDAAERMCQERADIEVIVASSRFRRDYCRPPYAQEQSIESEVRSYVRAWATSIGRRKPFPGFHPGIYLEQHGIEKPGADPFAEYLRNGCPEGPWNYPVISSGQLSSVGLPNNNKVALHLHVYYPELLPEITTRLSRNRVCPDLFVSIASEESHAVVIAELRNYRGRVVEIQQVANRGRDIGPFLTAFGAKILNSYDIVGHIHTKKSIELDSSVGRSWYKFILENLIGGESGGMADRILAEMENDVSIGMVFPDDPYVVGWEANRPFASALSSAVGIQNLPENFIFPIGTMFWARTKAVEPFINLMLDWNDYPEEPLPYDGSVLHAIERLFSLALSVRNLRTATTNVFGLTR